MPQERSEAIVLRGVDFSETSRIVTFLSPARGRFACMAAGAKRPKSGFAAMLDTFNRLEVVYAWKDGRSVQRLTEASLLDGFAPLKADFDKSVYAAFPLEVAYKTAQENEPSEGLYALLVSGLEDLVRWDGDARVHAAWQVIRLISEAGFGPLLEGGRPDAGGRVRFSYGDGVVTDGAAADRTLSPQGIEALRALAESPAACPEVDEGGEEAFRALRGYVCRQLESDLRSLRVIDQVFG